ncbi:hypothetical protein R5R35_006609 [Gryllus longicercus]|uniref:uS12 prolyl 3-hydroxylase n=1 Tax=Gryllus longicercus TaxID=2509291 RepID=A0AAN9W6X3_9ORTH
MEGKRKSSSTTQEVIKKQRDQEIYIRGSVNEDETKKLLRDAWVHANAAKNSNFEVIREPFKCCIINNLIEDKSFFDDLGDELSSLDLVAKNNDLYQFHQSQDLGNVVTPAINNLKNFLLRQCRSWLQDVTNIELNNKLSLTYSCYSNSDYLLCHDDKCEDRRIAFILYLNKEWKEDEGGALQLFSTDDSGQPVEVVRSIIPEFNKFVFFEVTDKSFHQVAEVLTDNFRMTVNGWFHSSVHCSQSNFKESLPLRLPPRPPSDAEALFEYINPVYLGENYHQEVSEIFEEQSQISLSEFLKENVYDTLCSALRSDNIQWKKRGPPNRRQYFVPVDETVPEYVKSFIEFFSSTAVFTFLHKLTKLDLVPCDGEQKNLMSSASSSSDNVGSGDPKCSVEIQMWQHGCYTLVNDDDPTFKESALDAVIYFNVDDVEEEHGGFTSYIARDEDLELLTVTPVKNALALSYRDDETLRFVKFINHYCTGKFYTLSFVYHE